jgi:hypothetical protein
VAIANAPRMLQCVWCGGWPRQALSKVLLVAFAGQGIGNLQWNAPCAAARAAGIGIDALYLADPANAYYMQDPSGGWDGPAHYAGLIRPIAHRCVVLFIPAVSVWSFRSLA